MKRFLQVITQNTDALLALGVVGVVILMIIPIPLILMDLFLSFSITFSIVIILISMYILKPLEFSIFPSLLLVATLFRLSLNVASTRLVLLNGHEGTDAAGQVIKSFGNFVVGGNYAVGVIVFAILVLINFVVITKGAGRIAEVSARFTLDAMPGKQMSIDADLNAGMIEESEARRRRSEISREAEFYGAMDGASKFVRGDAVAGIIITLINVIGGLLIGVLQHGMSIAAAAQNYTLLTVGDGLVAQLPALVISTAAGIVVTRAASDSNMGADVARQFLAYPKALVIASGILFLFGLVPGLPHLSFLTLSLMTGGIGYVAYQAQGRRTEEPPTTPGPAEAAMKEEKGEGPGETFVPLDLMEINIGYGLIPLVDAGQKGNLLERIRSIRQQFVQELGVLVPSIHIRDNLQLKASEYAILIKGVDVSRGELMLDHALALDPGVADRRISGIPTRDPAFGLPALWISGEEKGKAELYGYTVVDPPTVLATHLTEVIRSHAHELIGRQEVQSLLDQFAKTHPKVVEELIPGLLPLGSVVRVLQNLLRERVSIRDLLTILESLSDYAAATKDPELLTEYVRTHLARSITKQYQTPEGIPVITLDPRVEDKIRASIQHSAQGSYLSLEPGTAQKLLTRLKEVAEGVGTRGYQAVVLTSPAVRGHLRRLTERFIPHLVILSSNEIAANVKIHPLEMIRFQDAD
ncbi:MAG: flagellar biosynthesis protein FlhA [Nitrospirae bacterium]|nr:flagellar biosynthesis protein FlhA [Nitrospirota bacterium]